MASLAKNSTGGQPSKQSRALRAFLAYRGQLLGWKNSKVASFSNDAGLVEKHQTLQRYEPDNKIKKTNTTSV